MDDLHEVLLNLTYKLDLINKKLDDLKSHNQINTDFGLAYNLDINGNYICKDIEPKVSIKSGYDYLMNYKN
jgi:hypothetical protein